MIKAKRVPQPPKESKSIKQWMIKKDTGFSNIYPGFVKANTKSEARATLCKILGVQRLPSDTKVVEAKIAADKGKPGGDSTVVEFMEP